MFATAIAVALMCHSLGTERLHDIWNPYVALLPLLLLIFVCWSIACGEHRLLFLAVLIASFVAQAQVVFVFPALGLLLVAAIGLFASRHQPAWNTASVRRSLAAAFIVGLVCWSAPLYDEAIHRPGNLERIVQAGTTKHASQGAEAAWHAVVRTIGLPPWWLGDPPSPGERLGDLGAASIVGEISAVAVLAGLIAVAICGTRRRRLDVMTAAAIGLVLCATIALATATTPTRGTLLFTITYTLWWASPAGMFVWISLGWATATLLRDHRRVGALRARIHVDARPTAIAAFAALVAVALRTTFTPNNRVIGHVMRSATATSAAKGTVYVRAECADPCGDREAGSAHSAPVS